MVSMNEPMKNMQGAMDRKTVTANQRIHLTNERHVVVQLWGTDYFVCIRDFYMTEENGFFKPCKKGINLPLKQWYEMLQRIKEIEEMISEVYGKFVKETMKGPLDSNTVSATSTKRIFLTENRHVIVQRWYPQLFVCIREYYKTEENGDYKPGRKGINLPLYQWFEMLKRANEIEDMVREIKGHDDNDNGKHPDETMGFKRPESNNENNYSNWLSQPEEDDDDDCDYDCKDTYC
ncbi:uncharacterized protein LOC117117594 [Anneissia japonica]|uniref:uncharacterized protein LOC117117594 n=1 Tax=Anneissia japonica TaxID=1529436 RepID=UPI0014259191|nr:uncharacterized protein LOC117117594 [Anneissia japonica]